MKDGTKAIENDKKKIIQGLNYDDLKLLTDEQVRMIGNIEIDRVNPRAVDRVADAMEGKIDSILEALTTAPFIYTSDPISIFPTLNVRFSSTLSSMEMDSKKQVSDSYNRDETIDLSASRVNMIFMAHAITWVNGEPCAMCSVDPSKVTDDEHLALIRGKRIEWMLSQPAHVLDRLFDFHRAFQLQINSITKDERLIEKTKN